MKFINDSSKAYEGSRSEARGGVGPSSSLIKDQGMSEND